MTGGLGFVTEMLNRDKANKGVLKDMNDRHKRTVNAHAPRVDYENIETPDDAVECSESTLIEIEKIKKEAKRNRLREIIIWSILGTVMVILFLFLLSKMI